MAIQSDVTSKAVDESAIEAFKAGVRGEVLRPGDEGYDAARKVYNAMVDRHPALNRGLR